MQIPLPSFPSCFHSFPNPPHTHSFLLSFTVPDGLVLSAWVCRTEQGMPSPSRVSALSPMSLFLSLSFLYLSLRFFFHLLISCEHNCIIQNPTCRTNIASLMYLCLQSSSLCLVTFYIKYLLLFMALQCTYFITTEGASLFGGHSGLRFFTPPLKGIMYLSV